MLKNIIKFIIILIFIAIFSFSIVTITHSPYFVDIETEIENKKDFSVSTNGWLSVNGNKLLNEKGEEIQLTGISSHGIQWYSDLITYDNLKNLKEEWGINIFRIAMYSDAYVLDQNNLKQKVINIIDMANNLDMYVIIDWHILSDSNPNIYYEQANLFFDEMSLKYANTPNVIYEICNEPNGNAVTWDKEIKPYAEKIIAKIRNNNPKSLIIVGTPDWCKKLKPVADNPLNFQNIVYACHFYAGTHGEDLQETIDYALNKNIAIFVSECGLTDATGNGQIYTEQFDSWIKFLDDRNISWICWSLSNKDEGSAILLPSYQITPNTAANDTNTNVESSENKSNTQNLNIDDHLSDTGIYLKNLFNSRKNKI